MNLKELLDHELLRLPKDWSAKYDSYKQALLSTGEEYLELLEQLDEKDISGKDLIIGELCKSDLIEVATKVFQAANGCVRTYLDKGNPHEAFNIFREAFVIKENVRKSIQPSYLIDFCKVDEIQYRLRKGIKDGHQKELFHAPFELRHILDTNRYSIPGYPTLYLANSVYTAYKELGEPSYDNLYVFRVTNIDGFFPKEPLLDLRNEPKGPSIVSIYKFLGRWPLIMACNYKVAYPDAKFKAEYVLPQIVFQWVKNKYTIGEDEISPLGVCYPSTKVNVCKEGVKGMFYNTAIPVRNASEKGYCNELVPAFHLTKPISFQKALELDVNPIQRGRVESIVVVGVTVEYYKTDFGKIEEVLNKSGAPESETFCINLE